MAFPHPDYLTPGEISALLATFDPAQPITITRYRWKNKTPIPRPETLSVAALESLIMTAIEDGHQFGGDFELEIPTLAKKLIGHHDGLYWLKPIA
ncbi:MAG: hypothetical protein EOP87_25895 [Verrucomicrobiaceae bacterium]|nr:MAG: hypothetical protein EOP87_25895 [Verrucomicrobiaceae bacterium]